MAFYNMELAQNYEWGSSFGSGFNTRIFKGDSGLEGRSPIYNGGRRPYVVKYENRTRAWVSENIINFYHLMMGPTHGFRFHDRLDFTSAADGRSAGAATDQPVIEDEFGVFRLAKQYGATLRPIYKPNSVTGSTALTDGSPGGNLAFANFGIVSGAGATAGTTWGGTFWTPVRFDSPLRIESVDYEAVSVLGLQLRELRFRE